MCASLAGGSQSSETSVSPIMHITSPKIPSLSYQVCMAAGCITGCCGGVADSGGLPAGLGALLASRAGAADGVLRAGERGLRGRHQPRRAAAHAPHHPRGLLGPDGAALTPKTRPFPLPRQLPATNLPSSTTHHAPLSCGLVWATPPTREQEQEHDQGLVWALSPLMLPCTPQGPPPGGVCRGQRRLALQALSSPLCRMTLSE